MADTDHDTAAPGPVRRVPPDRTRAYKAARMVLAALGIERPNDIAMEILAAARGMEVRTAALTGTEAMLVRVSDRAIVVVQQGLPPERRRFTIGHELGHFTMHADASFLGLFTGDLAPRAYAESPVEGEANAFASELLMPRGLCYRRCAHAEATWDEVKDLADEFDVSLTAAAMRLVTLSRRRIAVVCVREGRVQWASRSWLFRPRIDDGRAVAAQSSAAAPPTTWSNDRARVPAALWANGAPRDATVLEHAFRMPKSGVVMVMLELEGVGGSEGRARST